MLDSSNELLSPIQMDILKEIGNIGAGNAASALAQMVNTKIDMKVPRVRLLSFNEVVETLGGADKLVAGIYLSISGSATCSLLFVLPIQSARTLAAMLIGMPPQGESVSEMEASALMEVGNIMCATYMNVIAQMTNMVLSPSVPALGIDMAGSVLDAILASYGEIDDHVLLMENEFVKDEQGVMGNFFLLPEPGSLEKIFAALGVSL